MAFILTKSVNQTLFIRKTQTCIKFVALVTNTWAHIAYNLSISFKYHKMTLTLKIVFLLDPAYWVVSKSRWVHLSTIYTLGNIKEKRKNSEKKKINQMYRYDTP